LNIFCGTKEDQTDQEHNSTWCCFSILIYVTEEGLERVDDVSRTLEFTIWKMPILVVFIDYTALHLTSLTPLHISLNDIEWSLYVIWIGQHIG